MSKDGVVRCKALNSVRNEIYEYERMQRGPVLESATRIVLFFGRKKNCTRTLPHGEGCLRTESNLGQELMLGFALIRESKETILMTTTKAVTPSLQRPNCSGRGR